MCIFSPTTDNIYKLLIFNMSKIVFLLNVCFFFKFANNFMITDNQII